MASVFIDTAYLVALLDPRDGHNGRAIELANYFSRSPLRAECIEWLRAIRADAGWEIVPLDRSLVSRGEARYRRHRDKSWSLTDCISMEVMTQRRIRDAATLDGGFAQAGFSVLMR